MAAKVPVRVNCQEEPRAYRAKGSGLVEPGAYIRTRASGSSGEKGLYVCCKLRE